MTNDDLFSSSSFSLFHLIDDDDDHQKDHINNGTPTGVEEVMNLDKFFQDVESIKHELKELKTLYKRIKHSHEEFHNKKYYSKFINQLIKSQLYSDVALALDKSKSIILGLQSLHRSNAHNLKLPGCGPGSSSGRTRTFILDGLREKLKDNMESFSSLRETIESDYNDTVIERGRHFMVTGGANEPTLLSGCECHDIESQQVIGLGSSFVTGGCHGNEEPQKKIITGEWISTFLLIMIMYIIISFMFFFDFP